MLNRSEIARLASVIRDQAREVIVAADSGTLEDLGGLAEVVSFQGLGRSLDALLKPTLRRQPTQGGTLTENELIRGYGVHIHRVRNAEEGIEK